MGTPPETFQPKIRKQNQFGFWNISSRLTSVASFIKIISPPFPTSETFSQSMTLKNVYRKIINPIQTGGGAIMPALTLEVYNFYHKRGKPTKLCDFS